MWLAAGGDGTHVPAPDSSDTDTLKTDTLKTTTTASTDYSTLGRLRKNINELDSLIYSLEDPDASGQNTTKDKYTITKDGKTTTTTVITKRETTSSGLPSPPHPDPQPPAQVSPPEKRQSKPEPQEVKRDPVIDVVADSSTTKLTTSKRTMEYTSSDTAQQPKVPKEDKSKWTLGMCVCVCVYVCLRVCWFECA